MADVRISVIVIFLNAERFIEEAIESVRAQTYPHWELLLVDDGSSDASTAIARRYAAAQPGRIRYLEHPGHANRGMSAARNLGIAKARGAYVAFLDADDVWLPQRLERHVEVLERHRDVAMVYGPTLQWFGWTGDPADAERDHVRALRVQANRRYEPPFLLTRFLEGGNGNLPGICSLLARREALLEVGGFEEAFRNVFEDQVLLSKMCLAKPVYVIDACLDRYRQHPDSCCAVAQRQGLYDPDRANPGQRAYLEWLEAYLAARGVDDPRLLKALRFQLLAYRRPLLYRIAMAPRRAPYALKLYLRRIGLLPPAARRAAG
jgi:glycosyltransferase involved in cell wall biosynthesis